MNFLCVIHKCYSICIVGMANKNVLRFHVCYYKKQEYPIRLWNKIWWNKRSLLNNLIMSLPQFFQSNHEMFLLQKHLALVFTPKQSWNVSTAKAFGSSFHYVALKKLLNQYLMSLVSFYTHWKHQQSRGNTRK